MFARKNYKEHDQVLVFSWLPSIFIWRTTYYLYKEECNLNCFLAGKIKEIGALKKWKLQTGANVQCQVYGLIYQTLER